MITDWDDERFVAADVEASGERPEYALQPWRYYQGKAWLTSFAAVWRENGQTRVHGMIYPDPLHVGEFLHWCIENDRIIVGWNLVYDIQWLIAMGFRDLVFKCKFLDGMLVWRHLDIEPEYDESRKNKRSYALKGKPGSAVPTFLPQYAGYEEDVDYHSTDPAELQKLYDYNVRDNYHALRITKLLYSRLKPKQRNAMWMEQRCLPMVAEANLRGLPVDIEASKALSKRLAKEAADTLAILEPHGVTPDVVASPKKLGKLLFETWGLPVYKLGKGKKLPDGTIVPGDPSTDKEVLFELAADGHVRAKQLRDYRTALNGQNKFADKVRKSAEYNEDGCSHPQARVFGTYTGRITISSKQSATEIVTRQTKKGITERPRKIELPVGWAQHQMKREKYYRAQIIAPEGYDMVEFDAAGQEFKWMAVASNDPTMLTLCQPGEDPHSFMTSEIYHLNYRELIKLVKAEDKAAEDKRKMGKIGNLSLQYRTSAKRLRVTARVDYDVLMTQPEADLIWRTYQRTYKRVPDYWSSQIARVRAIGYVETFGGRRVQVKGDWAGNFGWRMGSTAINYRIQGTGADQKYLAMNLLRDKLIEFDGYFAFDLHDGLYSFIPKSKSKKFVENVKPLLDDLPYGPAWGFVPPVPMNWDAKLGTSWGNLHGLQ